MPFDEHYNDGGGGGGGDDDRHRDMDDFAEGCITGVIMSSQLNGKCLSCTALAVGIKLIGRWLAHSAHMEMLNGVKSRLDQATNVDAAYGVIEGEMHSITENIMEAMKSDLADIVAAEQKEAEERKRG